MSPPAENIVLRIGIPSLNIQKAIRANSADPIWTLRKQLEEKVASEIKDVLNYGIFLHGKDGKKGKFLDERNTVGDYHIDTTRQLDFMLKCKIGGEKMNSKQQKKILDEVQKGSLDKLKEKTTKNTDFNFLLEGDCPMGSAVMKDDPHMITWLMDNGAYLDYRVGDKDGWKTPLQLAATYNKPLALKTLIQYGAWVDAKDIYGLSALYYAASGGNTECVLRLLLAKADTETVDDNGRTALHMVKYINEAALNNYDCIVALLIDFHANMHMENVGGNTPLHITAARNSKESAKWLLLRGAKPSCKNKNGKTAAEVAVTAGCLDVAEIINTFNQDSVIPPPPSNINADATEKDDIVQNVLNALSSTIGKEYQPTQYLSKKVLEAHGKVQSSHSSKLGDPSAKDHYSIRKTNLGFSHSTSELSAPRLSMQLRVNSLNMLGESKAHVQDEIEA